MLQCSLLLMVLLSSFDDETPRGKIVQLGNSFHARGSVNVNTFCCLLFLVMVAMMVLMMQNFLMNYGSSMKYLIWIFDQVD